MNEREALAAVIHATRRSIPPGWTSEIADAALASDWLRDHDAALVAQARSDALREAADAWQMGEWADAPRRPDRIQERIANAQHVTDWLRARAAASSHPTGDQP